MWFHCELYLHVHTQLISLLIFINWHGVCLRRKGKTPCFNSCLIRKDRDKSSGSQHFHEVSRTFPGLSHSQGQDSSSKERPQCCQQPRFKVKQILGRKK